LYNINIVHAIHLLYINSRRDKAMKKRVTFTLDEELIEKLKTVSEKTMIPQAKLIEKALKNVLKEHDEN
jgi:metal-responsive CopG/Arc/MetJ family transcriptional regulator